ncbi:MAG: NAD(P)/FAD-dependent oxidoreductase [Pseudohongiella sp.]|nr:NAD(P)/FAD-dependent oxidoreductase [Pseudohongiella sp.]
MPETTPDAQLPRIVIVGGGAGGLVLATLLGRKLGKKKLASVILADTQLTHIWKPLLHEVAAGSLNPYEDELNYFAQAHRNHFEFQPGTLTGLDRERKVILLDDMKDTDGEKVLDARELSYDYLVLAVGSVTNDFGTTGAQDFSIHLDTRQQAEYFHRTMLNHYYRAEASGKTEALGIVIVGAGATGVELAAEVHHAIPVLARYGLDRIQPADVTITLVESGSRILSGLDDRTAAEAHKELEKIGVQVLLNESVSEVSADGITTKSGRFVSAQLRVWSAGVKAPDFMKGLAGLHNERGNTLVVDDFLRTDDPYIFALGDCAYCNAQTASGKRRAVPPRAQSAFLQAKWLTKHFPDLMAGNPVPAFEYRDYGSLISLSEARTVGNLMGNLTGRVNVDGYIARLMYVSLYRRHQAVLYGWTRTFIFVLRDLLIRKSGPRLKMH